MASIAFQIPFGEPVVPRWQLDPRQDRLGLYLWGTLLWHLLLLTGATILIVVGGAVLS